MLFYLFTLLCLISRPSWLLAEVKPGLQVLAFANENMLSMGVGRYEPGKGWSGSDGLTRAAEPGEVFTIYTMAGEVAQVTDIDKRRTHFRMVPTEWSVNITPWTKGQESFGAAFYGVSPIKVDPAKPLPLDQPDIVAAVSAFLKKKKLEVPAPYITSAYETRMISGGPRTILLTAHSDASAMRDKETASVYALALLLEEQQAGGWKVIPIAQQTAYKPRWQSIDEFEHYHGTRDYFRLLACLDIDGDGRKEIVLYDSKAVATVIQVFTYDGRRVREVISSYKAYYN